MKTKSLWALVLVLSLAAAARPAIRLEEDQIKLLDAAHEKDAVKVGSFDQDRELRARLDREIFRKLGVKDEAELKAKGLERAYADELAKRVQVTKMEKPQLRFLDKGGNLAGLIPLASEGKPATRVFQRARDGKPAWAKQFIRRTAFVAPDEGGAAVDETIVERWVSSPTDTTGEYLATYSQVEWYDARARKIWEKPLDKETVVEKGFAAPGAPVLAVLEGPAPESAAKSPRKLIVIGKGGNALLELPKWPTDPAPGEEVSFSPHGKYLWASVSKSGWPGGVLVMNLESGRTWIAPDAVRVISLDDRGNIDFEGQRKEGLKRMTVPLAKMLAPPPPPAPAKKKPAVSRPVRKKPVRKRPAPARP